MPALTRIQLRRGTAGVGSFQWTSQVLYTGEIGYETDTGKFKVGDGSTLWSSLPYAAVLPSELNESIDDRVDALVVAGTGIVKSYNDSSNTLTLSSPLSAGSGIVLGYSGGTYTIGVSNLNSTLVTDFSEAVDDRVATLLSAGSNIQLSYNDASNSLSIAVTGISGLLGVKSLIQGTGIGISNSSGNHTINITGIPTSLITNFASGVNALIDNAVSASIVGGSGVDIVYSSGTNTLTISSALTAGSGISLSQNSGNYTISLNASGVDNSKLANSSVTIGLTPVSLGGSITSISGLSSVSSTSFVGNLSGTATNANNIEVDLSTSNVNSLVFVNGTDGNLKPSVNNNLKFNASSNELFGSLNTTPTTTLKYFTIDGGTP
jgi:hypothetical protein